MRRLKEFFKTLLDSTDTSRVCRTRMVSDGFFQCKVKKPNPKYCEYALLSGGGYICNHEDRENFSRK